LLIAVAHDNLEPVIGRNVRDTLPIRTSDTELRQGAEGRASVRAALDSLKRILVMHSMQYENDRPASTSIRRTPCWKN
jgi:hypothetical protein